MANPARGRHENSMETILTFDNRDVQSQWSVVWSTSHIPGLDNAVGTTAQRQARGRRRLRIGSLALSALITMHCRVTASALTGGFFIFMMFLVASVLCLANPLRHFEVYLGQWSISGPGRAFRIIPMLDGIGIAMCINALVRAINCCAVAAITAVYVIHSVADAKLPFTYCRDFNLKSYDPEIKEVKSLRLTGARFSMETEFADEETSTVGLTYRGWRNISFKPRDPISLQIEVCNETYSGRFPSLYSTPAYNFFYVEVVQYRSEDNYLGNVNIALILTIIVIWLVVWFLMIMEKYTYGRLLWNNLAPWFLAIPWLWTLVLAATAASNLTLHKAMRKVFRVGAKEIIAGLADALEVALYIHSASVGTELIHGKGLNHFASGHIDPRLNSENVWHSVIVLLLTSLHSGAAVMCALVDHVPPNSTSTYNMAESTLWIIPMYSKCTSMGNYSHLVSTLIFGGLTLSYVTVAFVLLKTALHTIFEYRVKLVFAEQIVVAALMITCMALSMLFATNGGIALLESVNSIMTGVAMHIVIVLELVSLLYVYRSNDFQSDMNLATEENTCSSRIGLQWQLLPIITLAALIMKLVMLTDNEIPRKFMYLGMIPLIAMIIALPLRAAHNAYTFLRPSPRQGT